MKKTAVLLCLILTFTVAGSAMAEKARGIASEAASAYHFAHLQQHLFAADLHGTGNSLKVREQPMPSNVLGHLEQADSCILLSLKNGYAKVIVTQSAKTSPNSWVGLTGWVDADYLDCNCNDAQYSGAGRPARAWCISAFRSVPPGRSRCAAARTVIWARRRNAAWPFAGIFWRQRIAP